MKRLLAAGSGSIFQICKVFRDGEAGRLHNPEFTMIEWYRTGYDHHQLMDEVMQLIAEVLQDRIKLAPAERLSYRDAFERHAGIDPLSADETALSRCAQHAGIMPPPALDRDGWLNLLMTHVIEPKLPGDRLTCIYDFPASQAALARLSTSDPRVAERFEVYLGVIELANGFHELTDANQQRTRFEADNRKRLQTGLPEVALDEALLSALNAGMPDCAGVALGFDRLAMLAAGAASINEVLAFPHTRG
jgi:lysyl-tRNA synthetase class 2